MKQIFQRKTIVVPCTVQRMTWFLRYPIDGANARGICIERPPPQYGVHVEKKEAKTTRATARVDDCLRKSRRVRPGPGCRVT